MAKVIGIDLGTSNSAMAVMEGGEPRIVENKEGKRTTPSVVGINAKTKERFVGELAKRQAITNPRNTAYSVKRFIGQRFNDPVVKREVEHVAYKVEKRSNGDVNIMLDDHGYTPAEISAMILRKFREDAEKQLGETVNQAVITVPAYFSDSQREATKAAGKIAGLEVLRIINEPTAAALAYGLDKKKESTIVVYDLGGGTFDVTVLQLAEGVFEVKSTNGDTHLGGDDFDLCLVDYVIDQFKSESGIDLSKDPSALQRVRVDVERAKIELSSLTETEINLPFITADASGPKHLLIKLSRAKLEELTRALVDRTVEPTKKALKDAGIDASGIDDVVLVGGMTRMPLVVDTVKKVFSKNPDTTINPDEVVALGAAIQAGVLQGDVKDVLLLDVTPLTVGIETLGGVKTTLIERNTTIPTSKTETFSTAADNQTAVEIHVVQGEREMAKDNVSIGRFTLDGIASAPRGVPKIDVIFDINADGILKVTAKDQSTSREQHITISGRSGLSDEEIDKLVKDAEKNAEADKAIRTKIDAKNQAESLVYSAEKLVRDNQDKLSKESKEEAEAGIKSLKEVVANEASTEDDLKKGVEELQTLLQKVNTEIGSNSTEQPAGDADTKQQSSSEDGDKGKDDVVEGEYREV